MIARIAAAYEAREALQRELAQEILMAVWTALPMFRGDASLKTFVGNIARKRAATHVSRHAREPRSAELSASLQSGAALPDAELEQKVLRERLAAALLELTAPQRDVVVLALEGFGPEEIAASLGITRDAAAHRLQRGKAALRARLDQQP